MLNRHARGARPLGGRQRGTGARLAMLVAALVLAIGSCGLADPVTKSRTDSMRGASWPGGGTDDGMLGSVAVLHTETPSPSATPVPFRGAFEPPDGSEGADDEPTARESGRTSWPEPTAEESYEELDHSPEPDPESDPCDAVGVLPDECDSEPEPTPCEDSAAGCDSTSCEQPDAGGCDPPDCDDGPTNDPTASPDPSSSPEQTQTPGATQTPNPTQTSGPSQTPDPSQTTDPPQPPDPSQTTEPTTSPSSPEPPDGEPGC